MSNNLLRVPFRISEVAPLQQVLTELIKKDYFQPASLFEPDLAKTQQLQTTVSVGSRDDHAVAHETYESALTELYHVITDIAKKFPDDCVQFEWYSTLGHKPIHSVSSLWRLEQVQLLFQIAALKSQEACGQSKLTEEGLKSAFKQFKVAAGLFDYLLLQNISMPLRDFDVETLSFLKMLMLAQAQEVIWQKAILSNNMKDSAIAKVSVKVSELYEATAEYGRRSEAIVLDWINHCKVKMCHFAAVAHYRMSIAALDTFQYGEQVGHLRVALRQCEIGLKNQRYVHTKVIDELNGLKSIVSSTLKAAEKDNDLVYLKPVPDESLLPAIVGVSMVAPELPENFLERRPDAKVSFASLVPFTIILVAQAFRERQNSFLKEHVDQPLEALSRMFARFLAERDLPASIDTIQRPEDIPDSLLLHSQEIRKIGGVRLIENSMDEIGKLAYQCNDLARACEEKLHIESEEDMIMKNRVGSERWTREPSSSASAALTARIKRMREYLDQGHESDSILVRQYEDIKNILMIYCDGREGLKASIPRTSYHRVESAIGRRIGELRDLLAEAEKLEQNRQRLKSSVAVKNREHNILPTVLSEFKKNPQKYYAEDGTTIESKRFEPVYEKFIKLFDTDLQYVETLKQKQMELELKIHRAKEQLQLKDESSIDASQQRRLEALQLFENAYASYLELVSNLNEASKFYTDFLEKGSVVMDDVDQYLYRRREEARELELSISHLVQLQNIEHSMAEGKPLQLAAPRGQRTGLWDPTKGIRFSE